MALRKTKSTSLTGESVINGTTVVRMTASLSTSGGSDSVNQYVQNVDLYNANKRDVRKDMYMSNKMLLMQNLKLIRKLPFLKRKKLNKTRLLPAYLVFENA